MPYVARPVEGDGEEWGTKVAMDRIGHFDASHERFTCEVNEFERKASLKWKRSSTRAKRFTVHRNEDAVTSRRGPPTLKRLPQSRVLRHQVLSFHQTPRGVELAPVPLSKEVGTGDSWSRASQLEPSQARNGDGGWHATDGEAR